MICVPIMDEVKCAGKRLRPDLTNVLLFIISRDKIETFIDENKALIKRMYGSFNTPGGNRVRRAPDMHDASGDSYFRHVRQASNTNLPDPQAINSTGR